MTDANRAYDNFVLITSCDGTNVIRAGNYFNIRVLNISRNAYFENNDSHFIRISLVVKSKLAD